MIEGNQAEGTTAIVVRDVEPGDLNFIYSTWKRGLCYDKETLFRFIPTALFNAAYQHVIESILNRPGIVVSIACLSDAPNVILGYAIYELDRNINGRVMHWIYTKHEWRLNGIATKLMPYNVKVMTHITRVASQIAPKEIVFNPFYPNFMEKPNEALES